AGNLKRLVTIRQVLGFRLKSREELKCNCLQPPRYWGTEPGGADFNGRGFGETECLRLFFFQFVLLGIFGGYHRFHYCIPVRQAELGARAHVLGGSSSKASNFTQHDSTT